MSSVFRTGTQGAQGWESIGIMEELILDTQQHQSTEGAGGGGQGGDLSFFLLLSDLQPGPPISRATLKASWHRSPMVQA